MEYIGIRGNTYYLLDKDSDEAYSFNDKGTAINKCSSKDALIELMGKCYEVDIISILGEQGSKVCELYFNGETITLDMPYLDVYARLNSHITRFNHIIYTIKHSNRVKQILIPLVKHTITIGKLKSILGCS